MIGKTVKQLRFELFKILRKTPQLEANATYKIVNVFKTNFSITKSCSSTLYLYYHVIMCYLFESKQKYKSANLCKLILTETNKPVKPTFPSESTKYKFICPTK